MKAKQAMIQNNGATDESFTGVSNDPGWPPYSFTGCLLFVPEP